MGHPSMMEYPSLYTWTIWEIHAILHIYLCFLDRVPGSQFRIDAFIRDIWTIPLNQKTDLPADVLSSSCHHIPCWQMSNFSVPLYWKETTCLLNFSFLSDVPRALHHMIHMYCAIGNNLCEWHPRDHFILTFDGMDLMECTLHDCVHLFPFPTRTEVLLLPDIRSASIKERSWCNEHWVLSQLMNQ